MILKGVLFTLASAISLGVVTSFAQIAYQEGTQPLTLIMVRSLVAVLFFVTWFRLRHISLLVPRSEWHHFCFIAIGMTLISYGYLYAVAYISPGLAAAILYTFPVIILAVEAWLQRTTPPSGVIISFIIAIIGIAMCVGFNVTQINPIGIFLASLASLGTVCYLVAANRVRANVKPVLGMVYTGLLVIGIGMPILLLGLGDAALSSHSLGLPESSLGWWSLLVVAITYVAGASFSLVAVNYMRASQVALIINFEPLVTLVAAWLLVNERLSQMQYLGMLVAIVAIFTGSYLQVRSDRQARSRSFPQWHSNPDPSHIPNTITH